MGKIVLLDELTINQIAAGEVIERPASVIKEMMENSIDAGATNISVEIKNGGISYIRITDNGFGISEDDMEIAFERHATSKIRTAEDLDTVKSMGFRGEALASIAAIANVEMISRTATSQVGHRIVVEGGKVLEFGETGCPIGTTIVVKNLFFNTPVRYKFLKKDYTESGYIEDVVTRLALVNKNIAIKFINSGKTIIQTSGNGDSKSTIYSIYGKDVADGIVDVNYEYEGIRVSGVVGKPEIARSNRSNQIFFVNKRYVKDKTLTAASEQAYKGMLPIGKFGFVILNLDMLSTKVDVNVHPAKLEVRFEEENNVFKAVFNAIKDSLLKTELIANVSRTPINEEDKSTNPVENEINSAVENKIVDTVENVEEKKEEKGITGFFKKIYREQTEETEEEKNNNSLKEIYEFRNELKKIGVTEAPSTVVIPEKPEISENQTVAVSATPTLESKVDEIDNIPTEKMDDFIRETHEKTKKIIESYYQLDNYNINKHISNKNENNPENLDETKIINEQENLSEETVNEISVSNMQENENVTNVENTINQETQVVGELENNTEPISKIDEENNSINDEEVVQNTVNIENLNLDENTIDNVTEKLMKEIEDTERTQIIDTEKVKEALNEMKQQENGNINFDEMYLKIFGKSPISEDITKEEQKENELEKFEFSSGSENMSVFENSEQYVSEQANYKFIGIAFATYIIIEINDEMYIIDQHASHERIMYEKVKKNYFSEDDKDSQMLLIPDVITLSHKETEIIKQNIEMFEKAGFTVEEFGENTVKLTGVPNICIDLNTKQLFLDLLDEIDTVAVTARQEIEDKFLATIACKSAVKAKMKLTPEEVDNLMKELLKLPNPFTCPHGRPTAIKMTKTDLEKKFSRRK